MKAILKNYRQSPRKVRLVANLIKGKKINIAEAELQFLVKRAALPFMQLLRSAVTNAKQNFNIEKDNLYVSEVRVDKGVVLKRSMPRARGSAFPIKKRTSHVVLVLREEGAKEVKNTKKEKKAARKEVTKAKVKKEVKPKTATKAKKVTTK